MLPLRPSTCASCWPGPSRASLYQLPGDPLHLPRRDAVGPRLRDGRRGGAVRARVPLDQALREMCPRAQLGDAQRDVARGWPVLARGSRCVRWPRPRGPCPPVRP